MPIYPALNLTGKTPADTYTNLLQKEGTTILVDGEGNPFIDLADYATATSVSASISESYGNNTASHAVNAISSSYTVTASYVDLTTITSSNIFVSQSLFIGQSGSSLPTAVLIKGADIGSTNYAFIAGSKFTNYLSLRNDGVFTINTNLGMGAGLGLTSNSSAASILFATGGGSSGNITLSTSGSSLNGTQRHIILKTSGSVGINTDTPLNGSSLTVQGLLTASVVQADSLIGTASFAVTASYALNGGGGGGGGTTLTTGSTYPITSSWAITASSINFVPQNTISSSYSVTSSYTLIGTSVSSSYALTSSNAISASWSPSGGGIVNGGSYNISSSWASSSLSSSVSITASYVDLSNLTSSNAYVSQSLMVGFSGSTLSTALFVRGVDVGTSNYVVIFGNRTTNHISLRNDGIITFNSNLGMGAGLGLTSNSSAASVLLATGGGGGSGNIILNTSGSGVSGTQRHIILKTSGSVGINTDTPLSGSSLTVQGLLTASIIQATSLIGTASISNASVSASYAVTASYSLNGGGGGGTTLGTGSFYPITSSWALNSSTASSINFVPSNAISSSYAVTASYYNQLWLTTGSTYPITSSWSTTASMALNALTASAINFIPETSSYSISSSLSDSSNYSLTSSVTISSSYSLTSLSSSYASTCSVYSVSVVTQSLTSVISASWASSSLSASYLNATSLTIPYLTASNVYISQSLFVGQSGSTSPTAFIVKGIDTGTVNYTLIAGNRTANYLFLRNDGNFTINTDLGIGAGFGLRSNSSAASILLSTGGGASSGNIILNTSGSGLSGNQRHIILKTSGSVGINTDTPLSGSSMTVRGLLTASIVQADSLIGTASFAVTASYALNGGGGGGGTTLTTGSTYPITSSWSNNAVTASYFNEASASLITGSFYLRSNSGSLWKLTVFEDGDHVGTLQLEGPF